MAVFGSDVEHTEHDRRGELWSLNVVARSGDDTARDRGVLRVAQASLSWLSERGGM